MSGKGENKFEGVENEFEGVCLESDERPKTKDKGSRGSPCRFPFVVRP